MDFFRLCRKKLKNNDFFKKAVCVHFLWFLLKITKSAQQRLFLKNHCFLVFFPTFGREKLSKLLRNFDQKSPTHESVIFVWFFLMKKPQLGLRPRYQKRKAADFWGEVACFLLRKNTATTHLKATFLIFWLNTTEHATCF